MKNRVKIIILLILLVILIIICKKIVTFDSINYVLNINDKKINIKELHETDNYYIEIKTNKNIYPFRIYEDFNNKNKIVKNLYIYEDDTIECILPVINDKIYTDIMCTFEDLLIDYSSIIGNNKMLDKYVDSITLYSDARFLNVSSKIESINHIKYNTYNNFNHILAITTYRGLVINNKEIDIFEKDIYSNKLSVFIDNYYVVADYENKYSFNLFYIIDIKTKEITKLKSKNEISYDSYIQGIVDDKIYLYDKNNENQYEIDVNSNTINTVSNNNYIKYYSYQKWQKMPKAKANKEIYFNYDKLGNIYDDYDYVKESDSYYYLFEKDGVSYKLYRVDKNNTKVYKYLFDIPTTNIYFSDNYLYYIYKDKLYYYDDFLGLKAVIENSELEFNDTIKYYIY